ncbi:Hypp7990 [Branchiostoma lanceolatum]|uniref:Hypp7990 protein n=1 Tax=Branchiostoma lanceolatum TaxID=7740 RepID=A0A8J9Z4X1_BRALA|nr:Hypp7990 [Branchiostoma lanceolatum]
MYKSCPRHVEVCALYLSPHLVQIPRSQRPGTTARARLEKTALSASGPGSRPGLGTTGKDCPIGQRPGFAPRGSCTMKFSVCLLLMAMVVMAMLIDDGNAWRRRRRRRVGEPASAEDDKVDGAKRGQLAAVESVLMDTVELTEELAARELEELEERGLEERGLEEDDNKK